MKKITEFIIDKRYFILIIFILLTIGCAFLSNKVVINYDIAKYLPDTSKMRIGMNIMEDEFSDVETSSLNVMFEDLEQDKMTIKSELESISGVKEVEYDESEKYNKDNYTLYEVTVDDKKDSSTAKNVYNEISTKYQDDTIYMSGSIAEANKSVLPFWIIVLAVLSALVILLIMCESYVEPFLFLTVILMAVVLNKGTNIIFPNVSHITNSICAILQMALSMDYSIMLMNRYDQEKQKEKDKIKAMKKALHKSFLSISSSSVTTIVGLLALIFMSFKIGKDLGFILAKGVLFSLICIFFVLPSLILLFDKWIIKTKKKTPHFKFTPLAKLNYKLRYLAGPVFILIFVVAFMVKGNLGILYTDKQTDEVSKVFNENNQLAIIYSNQDEEKIAKYLNELENNSKVEEVLGYSNTINEKLTYDKLNSKLKDLGSDVTVEDYLLKIVYYHYFNHDNNNKVTFNEFIDFIEQEAYNNPKTNEKIDENIKKDITRLKNFVTNNNINRLRSKSEIASILEINEEDINDLLIFYLSKNNNAKLTLPEFVKFMNNDVLPNDKYSSKINSENKSKLQTLTKFVNVNTINQKMNSSSLAKLFNIDEKKINELFKYYLLKNPLDTKMTINIFANYVLDSVASDQSYASNFDNKTLENLKLLSIFSNNETINKKMSSKELANLFSLKEELVNDILLKQFLETENKDKYQVSDFIKNVMLVKEKTHYLDDLDLNIEMLSNSPLIADPTLYRVKELASLLKQDEKTINQIYNLISYVTKPQSFTSTPKDFVNLLLLKELDKETTKKLQLIKVVMDYSLQNKEFTYQEIAKIINMDEVVTKQIYVLYTSSKNTLTLSPLEFTNFILKNQNDETLKNSLSNESINELALLKKVMDNCLANTRYDSNNLSSFLSLNSEDTKLLYGLYDSKYIDKDYQISLNKFINFLLNDVVNNSEYQDHFDENKITKLKTVKAIMDNSLNNVLYTNDEMFAIISKLSNDVEKKMIEVLYLYYGSSNEYQNDWQMTVEEFVNYLNDTIIVDEKFVDFIDEDMKNNIVEAKDTIKDAKELLVGDKYSRIVINTNFDLENEETFNYLTNVDNLLKNDIDDFYVVGDSKMAHEMSETFDDELNLITIITMVAIFIVVALTFKSIIIPIILVLVIQCAVYLTMGILTLAHENVYFIALLIVQSILMGATIDYAILYTSYYLEHRKTLNILDSVVASYQKSIHTILTSSSILTIVTLIIACFASAIAAKICKTISEGTICSTILILVLLPGLLATFDKLITKHKN